MVRNALKKREMNDLLIYDRLSITPTFLATTDMSVSTLFASCTKGCFSFESLLFGRMLHFLCPSLEVAPAYVRVQTMPSRSLPTNLTSFLAILDQSNSRLEETVGFSFFSCFLPILKSALLQQTLLTLDTHCKEHLSHPKPQLHQLSSTQ